MKKTLEDLESYRYLILAILIILAFYWYSYRPYLVNKSCIIDAVNKVKEISGDQTDARYYFWKCQKQHGLSE